MENSAKQILFMKSTITLNKCILQHQHPFLQQFIILMRFSNRTKVLSKQTFIQYP